MDFGDGESRTAAQYLVSNEPLTQLYLVVSIISKMPMPSKSTEEEAKQGVLQYAKAWGGTDHIAANSTSIGLR